MINYCEVSFISKISREVLVNQKYETQFTSTAIFYLKCNSQECHMIINYIFSKLISKSKITFFSLDGTTKSFYSRQICSYQQGRDCQGNSYFMQGDCGCLKSLCDKYFLFLLNFMKYLQIK